MIRQKLRKGGKQMLRHRLRQVRYEPSEEVLNAAYGAIVNVEPLLIEGERGAGKTQLAESLAEAFGMPLFFVSCYPGVGSREFIGYWDSAMQQMLVQAGKSPFAEEAYVPGVIVRALRHAGPSVLCIDEIDKLGHEDEHVLLHFLARGKALIPYTDKTVGEGFTDDSPIVIATSNDTSLPTAKTKLSSPLRSRFAYAYIKPPDYEQTMKIIALKMKERFLACPQILEDLCVLIDILRSDIHMQEPPSIREFLRFASRVASLERLNKQIIKENLSCIAKTAKDTIALVERLDYIEAQLRAGIIASIESSARQFVASLIEEMVFTEVAL